MMRMVPFGLEQSEHIFLLFALVVLMNTGLGASVFLTQTLPDTLAANPLLGLFVRVGGLVDRATTCDKAYEYWP